MAERRKFETILLDNGLVSEEQLQQVVRYAQAVGMDMYEAVLQKRIAPPDVVMMAYAESVGIPFVHLADVSVDEEVVAQVDPLTARQYSFVPVSTDQGYVLLLTTKPLIPDVADEIRMIFDMPVRCVLCTPAELGEAITKFYPRGTARVDKSVRSSILPPQPGTKPSKPEIVPPKPVEPMNAEDHKNRVMQTFAAFNFTFAFVYFASQYLPLGSWNSFYLVALLCIILGGTTAFIVWRLLGR